MPKTLLPSVVILATFGNWNKFHCTHLSQEVALQINTDFYSMEINDITYKIRGAIFAVYNALGPGLLESVYELALMYELSKQGLKVERQVKIDVYYDGVLLPTDFRLDILVEDSVIIELKSVEAIKDVHHKQLLTYMRLAKKSAGILVNFNTDKITESIFRKVL